ncbi:MAG: glutamate racemase [Methylobacteriaceae bacterium]|nr:glutamate racemase [Methylobacteriaceae bacterium]
MCRSAKSRSRNAGDLRARTRYAARVTQAPKILIFDSGLGGLTVYREIARLRPEARYTYLADDAAFPYGALSETGLVARVQAVLAAAIAEHAPDIVVIACNTASTLVLPPLRSAYPALPFVGTVPAVKPAAERSRSQMISVLATPGTVARDYTRTLIATHAGHCRVTLVGSQMLASLAEAEMKGEAIDPTAIAREIARCFVNEDGARTDTIVLACTHYPLLQDHFDRLAAWPVEWIDPAPAIARRVDAVLSEKFVSGAESQNTQPGRALFTSGRRPPGSLERALLKLRLQALDCAPMPAAVA